jgi:KDO2-lipid IV(A) lauroyltransferase
MVPLKFWLNLGRWGGILFYLLDVQHRKITLRNLRFAFENEKTEREIAALARHNFQQFGMIAHEWIRLKHIRKAQLLDLLSVEGKEHLMAAKRKSQSVILLGAHFGNWEYAHAFYASTINRLNFIVRAVDNPLLEKERVAYNQRFGVRIWYQENGLRPALRNLKRGEDLVIFADRKASPREGMPCRFFGKVTSTLSLVPALAQRFRIPVIPMFIVRCQDRVHHRILFLPELKIGDSGRENAIPEATQEQSSIIEQVVRAHPDHWVWLHKRWKKHYRYLYKEALAKRQRRREKRKRRLRKPNIGIQP